MNVKISQAWKDLIGDEFEKDYFTRLIDFVKTEYTHHTIYPKARDIFRAFDKCAPDNIKAVIIGQDPYHGPGQANGLCFSVGDGVAFPPSLRNIFKEIRDDIGTSIPVSGDLDRWADQGVLLLNSVLTVRAGSAASHAKQGWENFTDAVVKALALKKENMVYMLWGAYAQRKGAVVDSSRNCILKTAHPSPLSAHRGFWGSRHFSQANDYLLSVEKTPIEW